MNFGLEETGFLVPQVYAMDLTFGNTYFTHDDPWVSFWMQQWIEFMMVIVQNSCYFVGTYIFSSILGPILTQILNNYTTVIPFKDFLPGQESTADFAIDYRMTQTPAIYQGFMDLWFVGEVSYSGTGCNIEHDPINFYLNDPMRSQIVITETAAQCILQKFAQSPIGYVDLNEERWNRLFRLDGRPDRARMGLNTDDIAKHLPIFKEKLGHGAPKDLRIVLGFDNIHLLFGQFDTDVVLEYTMAIQFLVDGPGGQELIYDTIQMVASANVETNNDKISVDILNLKPDPTGSHQNREAPLRNTMNMSKRDYREFISTFGFTMNWMKWLNEVEWAEGLNFPFNTTEFNSTIEFQEKSMHVLLEVELDAGEFFDDEFYYY